MFLPPPSRFEYCFVDTDRRRYIRARVLNKINQQRLEKNARHPLWKLGQKLASDTPKDHDQALLWLGGVGLVSLVIGLLMGLLIQSFLPASGSGWVLLGLILVALCLPFIVGVMALSFYRSTLLKIDTVPSLDFKEISPPKVMEASKAALENTETLSSVSMA